VYRRPSEVAAADRKRAVGAVVRAAALATAALALPALLTNTAEATDRGHAATSRCVSGGLSIWVEKPAGNAAARSRYYFLRFTNLPDTHARYAGRPESQRSP
jgi:hypothetical protein